MCRETAKREIGLSAGGLAQPLPDSSGESEAFFVEGVREGDGGHDSCASSTAECQRAPKCVAVAQGGASLGLVVISHRLVLRIRVGKTGIVMPRTLSATFEGAGAFFASAQSGTGTVCSPGHRLRFCEPLPRISTAGKPSMLRMDAFTGEGARSQRSGAQG